MFFVSTPELVRRCFSKELIWEMDTKDKSIYLTFDDGPDPSTTPEILDILTGFKARATFFCVGNNIEKHPLLPVSIKNQGHIIGNHSYSHLNGWKTHTSQYVADVEKADVLTSAKLFRPPYGRIKPSQINLLKKKYKIIMWSALSGDFDSYISPEKCLQNSMKCIKPGAIVVFHDSQKAIKKVTAVLPEFLKRVSDMGFTFNPLHF